VNILSKIINRILQSKAPAETEHDEVVVCIHGLMLRGFVMYYLGNKLIRHGYKTWLYDYLTTRKNIAAHGEDFQKFLEEIAEKNPDKKINIVTHSLGSIVTRETLGRLRENNPELHQRISRVVMIAPPNKGSNIAKIISHHLPTLTKFILPLPELSSDPAAYVHKAPVLEGIETGIIAAKYDTKVSLEYTHLPGARDHIIINAQHTLILFRKRTAEAVLNFMGKGFFRPLS
jgi:pimeloyl-ACP methyl ester carboxylesterase